jgi:clan AA aspartic protease
MQNPPLATGMMRGTVNARLEATLRLKLRGDSGTEADVEFLIDTGFDSTLVLPKIIADALGLLSLGTRFANLADGSLQITEVYVGHVQWNGVFRRINIICLGDEALIGTEMLRGHELRIEVKSGGMVEINELP